MTAIARSGFQPVRKKTIVSPLHLIPEDITLIVPVKDNNQGIQCFLKGLIDSVNLSSWPGEIVIVDNNSAVPLELPGPHPIPITILSCKKPGPAAARNMGASIAQGKWLLFCDSDCIPTSDTISGYLPYLDGSVGYAGWVTAKDKDPISAYYESQEILIPPHSPSEKGESPEYLITCNCLVWKEAFDEARGFCESFPKPAGEDIDLGFRLRELGTLAYAKGSNIIHDFSDGLDGFAARFKRYGEGNHHLQTLYPNLNLLPYPFEPNCAGLVNKMLARLQFEAMIEGWNEYTEKHVQKLA